LAQLFRICSILRPAPERANPGVPFVGPRRKQATFAFFHHAFIIESYYEISTSRAVDDTGEETMDIRLNCTRCACHFRAPWYTPADQVLDRMDAAPWFRMAAGDTFEELVATAVATGERIRCPQCRADARVTGAGLVGPHGAGRFRSRVSTGEVASQ
jgi:hypothetical protein